MKTYRATYHLGNQSWMSYGDTPRDAALRLRDGVFTKDRIRIRMEDIRVTDVTEEIRISWETGLPMARP